MTSKTVWVVARLISKPDRIEETRAELTALIEPTRAEDGCISYQLTQNNADSADFTFIEEWRSDAALDAHLQSDHIRRLESKGDDLFSAAPDIRRYALIA